MEGRLSALAETLQGLNLRISLPSFRRRKEPSSQSMMTSFTGVVVKGRGFAAPLMSTSQLQEIISRTLGMNIVPGTLNVRLPKRFNGTLNRYVTVKELGFQPGKMPGVPERKGLHFAEVLIAGHFPGFVFQGDEPDYPRNQVELISTHNLRQSLDLRDGDSIEFSTPRKLSGA